MKVLVTGGTGFLGRFLSARLQAEGFHVTVLGRNHSICNELERNHFKVLRVDLTDTQTVINACKNQDYVFHCGALSSPWGKYQDFYTANVIGTQNIIKGCMMHPVKRLIHVSTPSIYFNATDRHNISEDASLPLKQINAYAKTKLLAEKDVNLAQQNGLNTIIIRPRGLFGPGDNAILPRLIKAHESRPLPLFNQGKILIDMTYVENVVEALFLCIHAPDQANGMKFNITNDEPMTLIELLTLLFGKLNIPLKTRSVNYQFADYSAWLLENIYRFLLPGKEPPFTRYSLGLLAKSQTLDIAKAKAILGYQPRFTIEEGLDRYVASLKQRNAQ